jgi:hypothetical protein
VGARRQVLQSFQSLNLVQASKCIHVTVALADGDVHILLRSATTDRQACSVIRSHFRNQTREFARAGNVVAFKAQNHIVFPQARFLSRTVFNDFGDNYAADFAHVVSRRILFGYIFSVHPEETAAKEHREDCRFTGNGGSGRCRSGCLRECENTQRGDSEK